MIIWLSLIAVCCLNIPEQQISQDEYIIIQQCCSSKWIFMQSRIAAKNISDLLFIKVSKQGCLLYLWAH